MVGQSEINNFNILYSLALSYEWGGAFKYLIGLLVLKHDHDILGFQVAMDDVQRMQEHNSFDHISNNKGTLKLIQMIPLGNVLVQIFSVNILCYDIQMGFSFDSIVIFYNLFMIYDFHYFALIAEL